VLWHPVTLRFRVDTTSDPRLSNVNHRLPAADFHPFEIGPDDDP